MVLAANHTFIVSPTSLVTFKHKIIEKLNFFFLDLHLKLHHCFTVFSPVILAVISVTLTSSKRNGSD